MKLQQPMYLNILRVFQFILTWVAGGLCIWGEIWFGRYAGYIVTWWSAFWTTVFMIWRLIEHFQTHNTLHVLNVCLEGLLILSWLVATILLAVLNASLGKWEKWWEDRVDAIYNGSKLDDIFTDTGRGSLIGSYIANAFAGALFISFVFSFAIYINTYRKARRGGAKTTNMSSV